MRLTTSQTWVVVGIASLIWLALSALGLASGGGLSVILTLADLIPAFLFAGFVYERWLWRWSPFHRVGLLATPVVIGTWRGDLESLWVNPKTGQRPPIKTVYLAIGQTATTVSVRLLSNESESVQMSGVVTKGDSGYAVISYNYRNTPDLKFREDNPSPIHHGGAVLKIINDPVTSLDGWYWTDRDTKGVFRFHEHSPETAQSFVEAGKLTFGQPRPVGATDGRLRRRLSRKPRP